MGHTSPQAGGNRAQPQIQHGHFGGPQIQDGTFGAVQDLAVPRPLAAGGPFVRRNSKLLAEQSRRVLELLVDRQTGLHIVHKMPIWRVNLRYWIQTNIIDMLHEQLEQQIPIPQRVMGAMQQGMGLNHQQGMNAVGNNQQDIVQQIMNQTKYHSVRQELSSITQYNSAATLFKNWFACPAQGMPAPVQGLDAQKQKQLLDAYRQFKKLEQYLDVFPNRYIQQNEAHPHRRHILSRILYFYSNGSVFEANNGTINFGMNRPPSDEEIVLHLFCTYCDINGPAFKEPFETTTPATENPFETTRDFTDNHLINMSDNRLQNQVVPEVALLATDWAKGVGPLHLQLSVNHHFQWDTTPGPENVYEAVVLFLLFVAVPHEASTGANAGGGGSGSGRLPSATGIGTYDFNSFNRLLDQVFYGPGYGWQQPTGGNRWTDVLIPKSLLNPTNSFQKLV